MKTAIINYLIDAHNLIGPDDVRYINDPGYRDGAIECNGRMPNSIESGWFFAGYEDEIEEENMETVRGQCRECGLVVYRREVDRKWSDDPCPHCGKKSTYAKIS